MFWQNNLLALHAVEIFCNLILRNHWTWTWKISYCLTGLGLTLRYIVFGLKKYLNYLSGIGLILWYTGVTLEKYLDYLTGVGLILWHIRLGLENTWTNSLDSDLFYYNQAGMLLEKYESLLEWSIKQLVIQSSLASSISLGHTMFGAWKTKW